MDTGTMVVAGQNWDIIGDILDAQYDDIQRKKKKKASSFCGSCSGYFELPQEFPEGEAEDINVIGGSNFFENPKNFLDKHDINVFGDDTYLGSSYFEGFEDYPAVMNDPNIYSFYSNDFYTNNFAQRDVRKTCGGKPMCLFGGDCGDRKKRYNKCADAVLAYNAQQYAQGGGAGSTDTTGTGGAGDTSGRTGAPTDTTTPPSGDGKSKMWIWIVVAVVVIVVAILLLKGKKNKTK